MDLHFIDANGNHFVVPDAPEGYTRDDGAVQIDPPPSAEHRWIDGAWTIPPAPPPPPIEIRADVLFFDRMTDDEYEVLDASVKAGETARVYRGWAAATVFTEGTAMWTLLDKHLSLVVTAERKAELLARPIHSAALAGDEALAA